MKTPVSGPSKASVVRDYARGKIRSVQGVASELGISIARARRVLDAYDVEIRSPHRRKRVEVEN
jgi:hypothetical protein